MKRLFVSCILAVAATSAFAGSDKIVTILPYETIGGPFNPDDGVMYALGGPNGEITIEAVADSSGVITAPVTASGSSAGAVNSVLPVALAANPSAQNVLYAKLLGEAQKRGLR